MDEPLFKASPSEIRFANFESLQNLDATLNLRNQDNVARRVKILQPDSTFFKVLPGKGRKADAGDNKALNDNAVAPGMEVSYIAAWLYLAVAVVEDYSYDLVVITERERFLVPIRATGGGALLDMPDELDFGLSPVKYEAPKTIMVRNVGEKPTKFLLKVPPPFSTSIQDGYLEVGEIMQVDVVFRPDKAEPYEREMVVIYGDGIEAYVSLRGRAENVNVTFSASQLQLEDTFIALSTQKTIVIHNNSEIPVQLKQEEQDEASAIQELHSAGRVQSEAESVLSDTSEEYDTRCTSLKGIEMAQGALQRRYKNITKAILEDPMFFYDEIFAVEPLSGRIWAKSKIAITFTFTPKAALNYQCLAYCSVVGRAERLPLLLKGTGIGPKAAFSYDELDVGDIFVESVHQYEVNLINQGDIDVEFRLVPNSSPFGSIFSFMPSDGRLEVGGECTIVVEVCPDLLGEFQETFYWELIGSTSKIGLSFRGHSVSPTFHFDLDRISFGVVSYGFLNSKTLTLTNTSEAFREFDVIPPKGTLLPNCAQKVQIDFVSMNVKSYDLCLVVDLDGVGQELASIPIQARCAVPQVALEPAEHVDYGDIFIRYPSHQTMVLNNTSALPAKFQIMPQEETTRAIAEFEPDQSFGSVPPASSHVLTFTLTSQVIGTLQIPITIRILGQSSARNLILIANTIGPIVNVEPSVVDWGNSHCLEPITRSVLVTNNSVIPASIRCIMKSKNSLWTLSPKAMELPPHGSANLNMTLTIDEVAKMTDTVHVIVHESNDVAVTVRAKGIGTPVMCREPLLCLKRPVCGFRTAKGGRILEGLRLAMLKLQRLRLEVIDFGTQYTTQTHSKEFVIENRGKMTSRHPEDAFDSRQKHPKARRDSQRSNERKKRHSRYSQRSRISQSSRDDLGNFPWNVEWNQILEATEAPGPPEVQPERKKKSRCCKRIRTCLYLLFVAAYIILVGVLVSLLMSERELLEAPGHDSPECQEKLCPIHSPCQLKSGEATCVPTSVANLRAIEAILGVVVGLPSVICIPCTIHWLWRRWRGKSWGKKSAVPAPNSTDLEARNDLEGAQTARAAILGKPQMHHSEVLGFDPQGAHSPPQGREREHHKASLAKHDDGLDDLFKPLAKHPVEAAEDELDFLFAPNPRVKARKEKEKEPKEQLEKAMDTVAVPLGESTGPQGSESEFSALFQRRLRPSPPAEEVHSELHSNFSEGVSVFFASMKRPTSMPKSTKSTASSHGSHHSEASRDVFRSVSKLQEEAEVDDFLDEELGDPPDFFSFAQKIALKAEGCARVDTLERATSEDSLGHLEPDDLADMLLDGKCAFRFVFNASSPKPGSLVDTLTCNELCGDDRKGKVIFRSELSGNFVLPLLELSATSVTCGIVALALLFSYDRTLMLPAGVKRPPPAPLAIRQRTNRLRDPQTGFQRPVPKEADFALDIFQRTFPEVTTEEHILIRRWEDIVDFFQSPELVNQLIEDEPSILRWPRRMARNALHYLEIYLGYEAAREAVFECPYLLTKNPKRLRESLPALINVLGSKQRLCEVITKYPQLANIPIGDFYKAVGDMTAVMGNREAALEVAKEAMERVARSPYISAVPGCYPVLIAIFGGLEEAHMAIEREPLLLKWYGENFLGRLGTLRSLLGKEGAQAAVRKAPYLLLEENQRKSRKFELAFEAMEHLFGAEEVREIVAERPELLALGWKLHRALKFAERRMGSREKVRDRFEAILERTGLAKHLHWERKQRPRNGLWTPKLRMPNGYPLNHGPWSPYTNPLGKGGPARGPWQDFDESEEMEESPYTEAKEDAGLQPTFH
ncbi:Hydrocephalus-inducing protein (Protein Hy-3) [Durusdinium trenchii]|uniref:Hydrocephalus-inducing protein (Protein Hy-3) n=1 Tax=Durusdinium trenchii TaxID=1381693 RepID=A0ABP0RBX0_9DINO